MLKGKKILLGVTGSIAAYKSALLIRLLIKAGAEVQVIMTESAKDFITPLTLSVLSKKTVLSGYFEPASGQWHNHVELGQWADVFLIAPASANTLAKMAAGICDNLLLAVYLSARCPVMVAPAMDVDMFHHPATKQNLKTLRAHGVTIMKPADGELASGLFGEGRMEEPENIVTALLKQVQSELPLKGKKALVTAGPTLESIDPVRFIGNHSTGKMGFAIAEELSRKGADVVLVTGPVSLEIQDKSIQRFNVQDADEMYKVCMRHFKNTDLVIMAAAVADYKPKARAASKIKKKTESFAIDLVRTKDILADMGKLKSKKQMLVGFALETDHEIKNAKSKLAGKNLDLIVLNSLRDPGAGFGHDTNNVKLLDVNGKSVSFGLKSKQETARELVAYILRKFKK